jgi:hypothetical protein
MRGFFFVSAGLIIAASTAGAQGLDPRRDIQLPRPRRG